MFALSWLVARRSSPRLNSSVNCPLNVLVHVNKCSNHERENKDVSPGEEIAHARRQNKSDHQEKENRFNYRWHVLRNLKGDDLSQAIVGNSRSQGGYGAGRIDPMYSRTLVRQTNADVYG